VTSLHGRRDPDLDLIWAWFEFQLALIGDSYANVLHSINSGAIMRLRPHEQQFIGFMPMEVEKYFASQRSQLETLTMFELLATTEAVLRIEVETRRKKDSLSKRFRRLNKTKGNKIRLDEDILVALKDEGISVYDFSGDLRLRDWLAHGRHWHPKLGRQYTPNDIFDISRALLQAVPQ